jgi:hypothetical protein
MTGETEARRSPNNLPTRPAGVRGSDHRPGSFQTQDRLCKALGHPLYSKLRAEMQTKSEPFGYILLLLEE